MKKLMESIYSRKGKGVHMRKLKGMLFLIVPVFVVLVVQINHAFAVNFSGDVYYNDESGFDAAAAGVSLTTEDFNSYTTDIPYAVDVGDFTLSTTGTSTSTHNIIDAPDVAFTIFEIDETVASALVGNPSGSQFSITFDTEINWLGFDTAAFNDIYHRTNVLIDGELVTLSAVSGNQDGFLGFFSADGFTDITFIQVGSWTDGFSIDNVQYNKPIPEPATVTFLGLGLAGLAVGAARRKWKKKSVDKS